MDDNRDADQARGSLEEKLARQTALVDLLAHALNEYWRIGIRMQQGAKPRLLPGEIARPLPVPLSVPVGSHIVGSLVWPKQISIYFESSSTKEDLLRFYDQHLVFQGWKKLEIPDMFGGGGGGFSWSQSNFDMRTTYCFGEEGTLLDITAYSSGPDTTTVLLGLNLDSTQSPCSPSNRMHLSRIGAGMRFILPDMEAPPNSSQMVGNGSSGNGHASSEAALYSDLDLQSIMTHYNAQLFNAGWTELDSVQNRPVGWSAWDFSLESEQWHGMLTIIERPWSKGSYTLKLDAEIEGNTDPGETMSSFIRTY